MSAPQPHGKADAGSENAENAQTDSDVGQRRWLGRLPRLHQAEDREEQADRPTTDDGADNAENTEERRAIVGRSGWLWRVHGTHGLSLEWPAAPRSPVAEIIPGWLTAAP